MFFIHIENFPKQIILYIDSRADLNLFLIIIAIIFLLRLTFLITFFLQLTLKK